MFKVKYSRDDKRILEEIQNELQVVIGIPQQQAKQMATEAVKSAIASCKKHGVYGKPPIGRQILEMERTGNMPPHVVRRFQAAREDGATDEDIVRYWSLSHVEQEATETIVNVLKTSACLSFMEQIGKESNASNIDKDTLMRKGAEMAQKSMPVFGDSLDVAYASGDDRRLPIELRHRIMKYASKQGADQTIKEESEKYDTYNAFIRAKVRAGEL